MVYVVKFLLWLLSLMPAAMPYWLAGLGAGLVMRLSPVKRHTAVRNLQRCYPDLDPELRERWVRESF
jgi:KDO2-lipid IV(A) lauroyltransferase